MMSQLSSLSSSSRRDRLATVLVALGAITAFAATSVVGCADSTESGGPTVPDGSVIAQNDAGDGAIVAEGGDAADSAVPDLPCAVGNLCRVAIPLPIGSIGSMSGRSKSDVWAAASRGVVLRWDGHQWTALESREVPENLSTLSSLFLTADEAWGVAGTRIVRRGVDPSSVRFFELFDSEHAPTAIAVLGNGDPYVGCVPGGFAPPGATGALLKISDFESGAAEPAPNPLLEATNQPQPMNIRAMFLVPEKALWLVGDRGAIARYPVSPLGAGVALPSTIQQNLLAAWATGDHLWAAGESGTILHFDGAEWHREATGSSARLNAIFGFSNSDIWAAGSEGTVLHFDGTAWSRVMIPNYSNALQAIWGASPDDVWIGGERTMFHWGALP